MTLQEAYALSAERQDNLAYRKRIQRIKNTILGVLVGSGLGAGAGFVNDTASRVEESPLDMLLNLGRKRRANKLNPATGAIAGALAGGLGGYGLTRLKENYDESAGLDPTLLNVAVSQAPGQYQKTAQYVSMRDQVNRRNQAHLARIMSNMGGGGQTLLFSSKGPYGQASRLSRSGRARGTVDTSAGAGARMNKRYAPVQLPESQRRFVAEANRQRQQVLRQQAFVAEANRQRQANNTAVAKTPVPAATLASAAPAAPAPRSSPRHVVSFANNDTRFSNARRLGSM